MGANVLVVTRAQVTGGELTVEARVYSVDGKQAMLSKRYSGRADNPRSFAHQASDDIVALTQYRGVARSKIAFVSDRDATRSAAGSRSSTSSDYDGFNARRITVNNSLNILPAWSPDGRALAYVSYRQGGPNIFVARIFEGTQRQHHEGRRAGLRARPSPRTASASPTRATRPGTWRSGWPTPTAAARAASPSSPGSDTAPTWSPTGQEIAFTSDRGGTPQLYVMDSEGLNVRRLTTVGNWNDAAAWNPSKEYSEIAYTARLEAGGFDIAVIDLATRQVRQVTAGRGSCEYPSWAPNGRHLVFSCKRGNTWQITISDREGRTVNTLAAGRRQQRPAGLGAVIPAAPFANRGVMKRQTFAVVFVALALLSGCGGKKRPPAVLTDPGSRPHRPSGGDRDAGAGAAGQHRARHPGRGERQPERRGLLRHRRRAARAARSRTSTSTTTRPTLSDQARAVLEKHALWLQNHRAAKVTVEGHCDERGTVDYNLALGDKRARAARDYLVSLGVAADRLRHGLVRQGAPARHRGRRSSRSPGTGAPTSSVSR